MHIHPQPIYTKGSKRQGQSQSSLITATSPPTLVEGCVNPIIPRLDSLPLLYAQETPQQRSAGGPDACMLALRAGILRTIFFFFLLLFLFLFFRRNLLHIQEWQDLVWV